ncbi:MAG: hydroxymethylpyrimidine/phosphomethylpyrimidine kinase, partial [Gammaproteobacteria bacterium HGW-Gammaproteobacteria-14]
MPNVPMVLDPVLAAEAGGSLGDASVPDALITELLPRATLTTPNLPEAQRLAGAEDIASCGETLLQYGCPAVLITGTHDNTDQVHNHLFHGDQPRQWSWPRLDGSFHGSGCTLASACTALLAQGHPIEQALTIAQDYVHQALKNAWQAGQGQLIPDRRG